MDTELAKALINAGVGGIIAGLVILLAYKLLDKVGMKVADSLQSGAAALVQQSVSMKSLSESITQFCAKDNNEHREMLVLLKYIAQKNQGFETVEREHNERMKTCPAACPET
jgi:hypothetical protein